MLCSLLYSHFYLFYFTEHTYLYILLTTSFKPPVSLCEPTYIYIGTIYPLNIKTSYRAFWWVLEGCKSFNTLPFWKGSSKSCSPNLGNTSLPYSKKSKPWIYEVFNQCKIWFPQFDESKFAFSYKKEESSKDYNSLNTVLTDSPSTLSL